MSPPPNPPHRIESAHITKSEPLVRPPPPPPPTILTPQDPADAKWLRLRRLHYLDPTGRPRLWESAERATRRAAVDAVGIVAILYDSRQSVPPLSPSPTPLTPPRPFATQTPRILLQKQFRPPAGRVVIEVPAGLLDEGEDAAAAAARELREETGYVGVPVAPGALARFCGGGAAGAPDESLSFPYVG